jgi:phenylacetate-CoA ligase
MTERQVALLQDLGARVLCATPSYALNIAEVAEREGVDLSAGALEIGVFGAEPWSEAMRQELETRLGIRAVDVYGLSEIMGPGVAVECEAQDGLHGWEDHFLFEIIDPASGTILPEGAEGELVITTLTKEALPLIRYRTRDITSLARGRCGCGRSHVRIRRITGRNDDMLIIRGVNVFPTQVEEVLGRIEELSPHYQLVVSREGTLDELEVRTEVSDWFFGSVSTDLLSDEAIEADHALRGLRERTSTLIRETIGCSMRVSLVAPGTVPRSEGGKLPRVVDTRTIG